MSSDEVPRVRRAGLPLDAVLIVRGGSLEATVLRRDAESFVRRFAAWGLAGVSAFYARDANEVDALCETKLASFATVLVFRLDDLETLGLQAVGTFRTPHVTLAASNVERLVERLLACPHRTNLNPYHEREPKVEVS